MNNEKVIILPFHCSLWHFNHGTSYLNVALTGVHYNLAQQMTPRNIREWKLRVIWLDAANVMRNCGEQCFHQ